MTSPRNDLDVTDNISTTKPSPTLLTILPDNIEDIKSEEDLQEQTTDLLRRRSFFSTFLQELEEAKNEPLNIKCISDNEIEDEDDNEVEDEEIDEVDNEEEENILNESYIEEEEDESINNEVKKEIGKPILSNQISQSKWLFTPAKQNSFNHFLTPNITKSERSNIKSFFTQIQDKNRFRSKELTVNSEGEKETKKSLFLPQDDKITNYNFTNRKLSSNVHKLNHDKDVIYEDEGEIDNTDELCKMQEDICTPSNGSVVGRFATNQGLFSMQRLKNSLVIKADKDYTPLNTKSLGNKTENLLKIDDTFECENKENVSNFDENNDSLKFSSKCNKEIIATPSSLLQKRLKNEKLFSYEKINKNSSCNGDVKENSEEKEDSFKNINRDIIQTPLNKNPLKQQFSSQTINKKDVIEDGRNSLDNKENSQQNKSFEKNVFKTNFQTPSNQISLQTQEMWNQKLPSSQKISKSIENNPENKQNHSQNPPKVLCTIPLQKSLETFAKLTVNKIEYVILNQIGRGGSSIVYHCHDVLHKCERAIKKVNLTGDKTCIEGYINEVKMLHKLQKCNRIIRMFSYEIVDRKILYMVLEKGERDLSMILKELCGNTDHLPLYMLIYYFMEMLYAVKQIHENGIIHSDLKPANFLMISSKLKLIDFGIASSLQNDMTSVVKTVQIGSFNYISPEALNNESRDTAVAKFKISYKSDVWSLGCILYQLIYKKTPFQHIGHPYAKLSAIIDPKHVIEYPEVNWVPSNIIKILKSCLFYDMKSRPSVNEIMTDLEKLYY